MTEQEAISEMRRIERQLMVLGNNAFGNREAHDAIIKAHAALHDFTETKPKDQSNAGHRFS
ncbi:hypothetical protein [Roseovarius sp. MMSF_3281]|uniref:hypothetical protein n=1 Tax=Roseovarius sp. MMSF_3281 TaxID=3046694 RepID=UPI00273DAF3F|nr:hypothetical protein [Roseovarius sp. MMSF_3281]